jgi:hypothetical protein
VPRTKVGRSYNNPHYEKDLMEGKKIGQDGGRDMLRRVGDVYPSVPEDDAF